MRDGSQRRVGGDDLGAVHQERARQQREVLVDQDLAVVDGPIPRHGRVGVAGYGAPRRHEDVLDVHQVHQPAIILGPAKDEKVCRVVGSEHLTVHHLLQRRVPPQVEDVEEIDVEQPVRQLHVRRHERRPRRDPKERRIGLEEPDDRRLGKDVSARDRSVETTQVPQRVHERQRDHGRDEGPAAENAARREHAERQ